MAAWVTPSVTAAVENDPARIASSAAVRQSSGGN
jgi:hypothetical protein